MKKLLLIFIFILACSFCSCGSGDNNEAAETTFELLSDGSVVHTIVEKSDQDYSEDDMKAFFESEVASYNAPYEEEHITLDSFEIRDDGTVYSKMTYSSVKDYAAFNDVICYTGQIRDALDSGYSFEKDMISAKGGEIVGFTLPAEYPSLKVLILQESMNVIVPGDIAAYSSLITMNEDGSAAISDAPDERLPEYFRTVNSVPEYIVYRENISEK